MTKTNRTLEVQPPLDGRIHIIEGSETARTLVLLNFQHHEKGWDDAIEWGERYELKPTHHLSVIKIEERYPNLHQELGGKYVLVLATQKDPMAGDHVARYVRWDNSGRANGVVHLHRFRGEGVWFAFEIPR